MSPTPRPPVPPACSPSEPGRAADPLRRALEHPVARRRAVLESFFSRWPGTDAHPLGLGRALAEFQEWEIDSGRLGDGGGSPWWSAVNGRLVSDIEDAVQGAAGPWADYVAGLDGEPDEVQALLWKAHQHSIDGGAAAAEELLASEPAVEQEFARFALVVVDMAAAMGQRTSGGGLGRQAREHYPTAYPCTEGDLRRIRSMLGG